MHMRACVWCTRSGRVAIATSSIVYSARTKYILHCKAVFYAPFPSFWVSNWNLKSRLPHFVTSVGREAHFSILKITKNTNFTAFLDILWRHNFSNFVRATHTGVYIWVYDLSKRASAPNMAYGWIYGEKWPFWGYLRIFPENAARNWKKNGGVTPPPFGQTTKNTAKGYMRRVIMFFGLEFILKCSPKIEL